MSDLPHNVLQTLPGADEHLVARIGNLTRLLRNSMHELGLDKTIEEAAQAIPDARERLRYVAHMTEQAATEVLSTIEKAQPLQDEVLNQSSALIKRVEAARCGQPDPTLDADILTFIKKSNENADQTCAHLMNIMMAQSFQDLTGQVITKMMDLIKVIEQELIEVLIESIPSSRRDEAKHSLLNGPQINPKKPDVVSNQDQVDDLLSSLGF